MRELIPGSLHLFFRSLYLSVFQILCLLTFSLFPPDLHISFPLNSLCFRALSLHPFFLLPFMSVPLLNSPPSAGSPSFPLPRRGFMGLWCMVISAQTHLSAHSLSSFPFLSLTLSFFFLFLVAQQGSELPDDAYRIFTFDFPHAEQSGVYEPACKRRQKQSKTTRWDAERGKEQRRAEREGTEQRIQIQSTALQIKANAEQRRIKMKSMKGLRVGRRKNTVV